MWSLAWQTTKARLSGFVGAFIAILLGTALVAGCGILMESGIRAGVPTQRYAAAAVVVGGVQTTKPPGSDFGESEQVTTQTTVSDKLVSQVAAVPGVQRAVPEQSFPANVVTRDNQVLSGPNGSQSLGHNWDAAVLAPFVLRAGHAPAAANDVVLDADLAARSGASVGSTVRISTRSTPMEFRVSGIAATTAGGGLSRQSALFFTADRAAELSGKPGQLHAIGVLAAPGVSASDLDERISTAVADAKATVAAGVERSAIEFLDVSQTRTMLFAVAGSFGGFALVVAMFVVSSTLALVINQRRREFALLRAIAATPKQIRRLISAETMLVATVAGLLGAGLGVLVADGLRRSFASAGVIPPDFGLAVGPIPLVAAFLLGLGAARLAAFSAGRRPSSIRPIEALGEAAVERRELGRSRVLIGLILVALGFGGATVPLYVSGEGALAASSMSSLVVVIGLALLGPKVVSAMTRIIGPVYSGLSRISGYLASASTQANARRLASAVTPVMLAVTFAISMFYSQTSSATAKQELAVRSTTADYVLTSTTGRLSPEVAAAARNVHGVAAATSVVNTDVVTTVQEDRRLRVMKYPAQGLDGDLVRGVLDLGVVSGNLNDLRGDTVAMSKGEADWYGKKVGDEVSFWFGDSAPAQVKLVAVYTHNKAFGEYVLPAELARAHTGARMDNSVLVREDPKADPAVVAAALRDLGTRYPGLVVRPGSTVSAVGTPGGDQQFYLNLVAVGVILGYVVISVASTLVMSTAQRSREFALLRLIGTTRRQVVRMMRLEALATAGIAVVLGTVVAAIPLALLNFALRGTPLPSGTPAVLGGIVGGAFLLSLVSLGLSTRVTLRAKPIEAIGLRE